MECSLDTVSNQRRRTVTLWVNPEPIFLFAKSLLQCSMLPVYGCALHRSKMLTPPREINDDDLSRRTDLIRIHTNWCAGTRRNIDQRPASDEEQRHHPTITSRSPPRHEYKSTRSPKECGLRSIIAATGPQQLLIEFSPEEYRFNIRK